MILKICFHCIIVLFLCLLLAPLGVKAQEQDISVSVEYGFNSRIKVDRKIPVRVKILNSGNNFNGSVQLVVPNAGGQETVVEYGNIYSQLPTVSYNKKNYMYEEELKLEPYEEAEVVFHIKAYSLSPIMNLIIQESGQEVYSEEIHIETETGYYSVKPQIFVGFLREDENLYYYINGLSVGTEDKAFIKTFSFTEEDFPVDDEMLDAFDILIIEENIYRKLNIDQRQALDWWIEEGGRILVDTNSRLLADNLAEDQQLNSIEIPVLGQAEAVDELNLGDRTEAFFIGERGKGKIGLLNFRLEDNAKMENDILKKQIFTDIFFEILGENMILETVQNAYGGWINSSYWMITSALDSVYMDNDPAMGKYIIIFILYVVAVGPVLYYFLWRIRKRELAWRFIALISVMFTLFIYVISSGTRMTAPFLNYFTVLSIDGQNVENHTFFNIRAPYNKSYSLYVDPEYALEPCIESNIAYGDEEVDLSRYQVGITYKEKETQIVLQGLPAFQAEYFALWKEDSIQQSQGVDVSARFYDSELKGHITNNLGYDLEDVSIVFYNYYCYIGKLDNGAKINLSDFKTLSYDDNMIYWAAAKMAGYDIMARHPDMNTPESYQKCSIYNYFLYDKLEDKAAAGDAYIIGITNEKDTVDFQMDSGYDAYGSTMVTVPVELAFMEDNRIYNPYISQNGEVASGEWYSYDNSIETEEVAIIYSLGNDLEDIILSFEWDELENDEYSKAFSGAMYFLNQNTNMYDQITYEAEAYDMEFLENYLTKDNKLTVRYEEELPESYQIVKLPRIRITGEMKD